MTSKRLNAIAFFFWLLFVPVAVFTNLLESVPFIAACSLYANAIAHLAAWRADA